MDAHIVGKKNTPTPLLFTSDELMGRIPFTKLSMDSDVPTILTNAFPTPIPTTTSTDSLVHYLNTQFYAPLMQPAAEQAVTQTNAEAVRRHRQEQSICLIHLLITCTGAIQAGDYSVAHGNLCEARSILKQIPTSTGIGRVGNHFVDALAQRIFLEYPHSPLPTTPPPTPPATYCQFYDVGPYLKFAYSTANQAILKAFEGCKRVHIVDFALLQGFQWPALMDALSKREGGPPELLRITGLGPKPTSGRDELREVGVLLAKFASYVKIPFKFQGICMDNLHQLTAWIRLELEKDEALAINSILQLHRLLVDPDANNSGYTPIDILLKFLVKLKPKIFTVVEQEADHNKPQLLERFTNALFHYATMFDSLEAMFPLNAASAAAAESNSTSTTSSLAEAYLRREIFNIICGEGTARTERHERFTAWKERLTLAGFTQVEFDLSDANMAIADLISVTSFSGSGFSILQGSGGLALAWHDRPLYVVTAWHALGGNAASATMAHAKGGGSYQKGKNGSSSNSKGNRGRRGVTGGITFL